MNDTQHTAYLGGLLHTSREDVFLLSERELCAILIFIIFIIDYLIVCGQLCDVLVGHFLIIVPTTLQFPITKGPADIEKCRYNLPKKQKKNSIQKQIQINTNLIRMTDAIKYYA